MGISTGKYMGFDADLIIPDILVENASGADLIIPDILVENASGADLVIPDILVENAPHELRVHEGLVAGHLHHHLSRPSD